jgi:hypothetical protein
MQTISSDQRWYSYSRCYKTYKLTGKVQVNNGATLTIPGTVIQGTGTQYIAVAQGGKINVEGTAAKPVVMTSGLTTKLQVTGVD